MATVATRSADKNPGFGRGFFLDLGLLGDWSGRAPLIPHLPLPTACSGRGHETVPGGRGQGRDSCRMAQACTASITCMALT